MLGAACGDGAAQPGDAAAAAVDAAATAVDAGAPPVDADPLAIRIQLQRIEDRLGGAQTPVAEPWGNAEIYVVSLADPGNARAPTRHEGATAVFDGVPPGPYLFVQTFPIGRFASYFRGDERTITKSRVALVSDATWPQAVDEVSATLTLPSPATDLLFMASSEEPSPMYELCRPGSGSTVSCTLSQPPAMPWGGGAKILVVQFSDPLRYLLADGVYDAAARRVSVSGTLVSTPVTTWSYDVPVSRFAATLAAADPTCTEPPENGVSLRLYPRQGRALQAGTALSTAFVPVNGTADLVGSLQAVVPPGYETQEEAFIRIGGCVVVVKKRPGEAAVDPDLAPVRNIRINDEPLQEFNIGAGATPTLSWDPPATGSPREYRLEIGGPRGVFVTLPADVRSLKLPPGWFTRSLVVTLYAVSAEVDGRTFTGSRDRLTMWGLGFVMRP